MLRNLTLRAVIFHEEADAANRKALRLTVFEKGLTLNFQTCHSPISRQFTAHMLRNLTLRAVVFDEEADAANRKALPLTVFEKGLTLNFQASNSPFSRPFAAHMLIDLALRAVIFDEEADAKNRNSLRPTVLEKGLGLNVQA